MCIPDISGRLTPFGNVVIESHRDTGHVSVRLRPRDGVNLRHNLIEKDGEICLDMWSGKKTPALHDEVTIDGKSVEVVGVTREPDGSIWITADSGERMRWE